MYWRGTFLTRILTADLEGHFGAIKPTRTTTKRTTTKTTKMRTVKTRTVKRTAKTVKKTTT